MIIINTFSALYCVLSPQNKLKKIKEKYKDQDEEDRELMMQLLGVRAGAIQCVLLCAIIESLKPKQ